MATWEVTALDAQEDQNMLTSLKITGDEGTIYSVEFAGVKGARFEFDREELIDCFERALFLLKADDKAYGKDKEHT